MNRWITVLMSAGLVLPAAAFGMSTPTHESTIHDLAQRILKQRYPLARVELRPNQASQEWFGMKLSEAKLQLLGESQRGTAHFRIYRERPNKKTEHVEVEVPFSAWMTVPVAIRKIRPKETLSKDLFRDQEVDFAKYPHKQYMNLVLNLEQDLTRLETRFTILSGSYPLSSGVQKIPDVRRGDGIKVRVISNGVILTTRASVQQNGNIGQKIRVLTENTKKELTGTLKGVDTLEVQL